MKQGFRLFNFSPCCIKKMNAFYDFGDAQTKWVIQYGKTL